MTCEDTCYGRVGLSFRCFTLRLRVLLAPEVPVMPTPAEQNAYKAKHGGPPPSPSSRLVFFPYGGGGPTACQNWVMPLAYAGIEVMAISLPGVSSQKPKIVFACLTDQHGSRTNMASSLNDLGVILHKCPPIKFVSRIFSSLWRGRRSCNWWRFLGCSLARLQT